MISGKILDKLMCGSNIKMEQYGFTILNYSLEQIYDQISEGTLNHYLKICIIDTKDLNGVEKLKGRTELDFFLQYTEIQEILIGFLNLFTSEEWFFNPRLVEVVTSTKKDRIKLTQEMFSELKEICKEMYCLHKPTEEVQSKAKTQYGEDLLKEFMEEEQKINRFKNPTINIQSIIFGVASRPNSGYNMFTIMNLKMYQLMKVFYHLKQWDRYYFSMQGLYGGTVDAKDIEKLNWANAIDFSQV